MPTFSETSEDREVVQGTPEGSDGPATGDDRRQEMLRYVERFAMALAGFGMQRMPARVFAYILCDDDERYTAAELATALQVSPAAISGAVRALMQARLIGREREPGARVDTYRVYDEDLWGTITLQRADAVLPFEELATEGVELLGKDTPGGRRLHETREYFRFFRIKMREYLRDWEVRRRQLFDEGDTTDPSQ